MESEKARNEEKAGIKKHNSPRTNTHSQTPDPNSSRALYDSVCVRTTPPFKSSGAILWNLIMLGTQKWNALSLQLVRCMMRKNMVERIVSQLRGRSLETVDIYTFHTHTHSTGC